MSRTATVTLPRTPQWDPYTDVWRFVEEGLDVVDY
jgi:hypothetical protein